MRTLWNLIFSDLRQIFRDHTLTLFLFVPVILIAFVRYFVPYVTGIYPVVAEYHPIIMMFGAIQTAIMFGFISSFIILEEKDEQVLQVIRVSPMSPLYFILYRLLFAVLVSTLGAFAMIRLGGLAYPGMPAALLLSVQYGLTAPFITLIIATYAQNKVEGMAYFKGVDLLLLLPMLSFLIPGNLKFIFGFIPVFWTYSFYQESLAGASATGWFLGGMIVYATVLYLLFIQFKKRVFGL